MARKAATADPDSGTTNVNIADFQRTRDSVIVALATLQSSVQDLSRAYINHANTVLNPGRSGTLDVGLTNTLVEAGLLGRHEAPLALDESAGDSKKKRKRAKHDPNAPKRALTPYFLYMQTARANIARELGPNAKPKEVADEGTRRWSTMKEEDKMVWNEEYQKNLAVYRVKTAAYKAGQPVPTDDEAQRLVEAGKVPAAIIEAPIEAEDEDEEEEEEEEESSPEPVRAPSPPKSKRRKSEKTAPVVEAAPTPVAKPSPKKDKSNKKAKKEEAPPPPPASSDKKKKSKKAA